MEMWIHPEAYFDLSFICFNASKCLTTHLFAFFLLFLRFIHVTRLFPLFVSLIGTFLLGFLRWHFYVRRNDTSLSVHNSIVNVPFGCSLSLPTVSSCLACQKSKGFFLYGNCLLLVWIASKNVFLSSSANAKTTTRTNQPKDWVCVCRFVFTF